MDAASPFAAWESFYVIVGSSAAALTGLQFVVITLGAQASLSTERTTRAFGTPTVVHFCAVLLDAAILSAPWRRPTSAGLSIAAFGLAGAIYSLVVLRRARRQTDYRPVLEDWVWHVILPFVAYVGFLVGGVGLPGDPPPWLFVIGAAALLLLFVGIHNAWDAVTYIAQRRPPSDADRRP